MRTLGRRRGVTVTNRKIATSSATAKRAAVVPNIGATQAFTNGSAQKASSGPMLLRCFAACLVCLYKLLPEPANGNHLRAIIVMRHDYIQSSFVCTD
jgi:hypothetical protein